jgi:putative Ca2+/H+ antiporter (TMEM165/GDT1 family)
MLAEIGDKTFFLITALSMKYNNLILFCFAAIALNLMNAVSVAIGAIFPLVFPVVAI